MSISGFKTLFDTQSTRLERIRALASPTDIQTGIIDYVTVCNKAYFENVGPTSTTGTALAAVVDLYDALQGRETGQVFDVSGVLKIAAAGIGIGGAAVGGNILTVVGNSLLDGTLTVYGTSSFSGVTVGGSLTVADVGDFINESGEFRLKEKNLVGLIGQQRVILTQDEYGNTLAELFDGNRGLTHPKSFAGNFGLRMNTYIPAYFNQVGALVLSAAYTLDQLPSVQTKGLHILSNAGITGGVTFYSSKNGQPGGATTGGFTIQSKADWIPGTDTHLASLGAKIVHAYNNQSGANTLTIQVGEDDTLIVEKDKLTVAGGVGFGIDFTVRSFATEPNEYYCRLHPNRVGHVLRSVLGANAVVPALQLGSGHSSKTMRLGFDSYSQWNYPRLYLDNQSTPNTIPVVALGKPLGDYTTPIDNFLVCDSPWLVAVNTNPRRLSIDHANKQGLFIGRGLAGTNDHKAGILWLEDAVQYRSAIHFGTASDHKYVFVKSGALMTHTDASDAPSVTAGLGNGGAPGSHILPLILLSGIPSTDPIEDIVFEITQENISGAAEGAIVMCLCSDSKIILVGRADGDWYKITG